MPTALLHCKDRLIPGSLHACRSPPAVLRITHTTAIDVSNHHVFVGDSTGTLHLLACELHGKQLTKLRHTTKLRLAPGGAQAAAAATAAAAAAGAPAVAGLVSSCAVTVLQYVPYCHATDTAIVMAAMQDGSLVIVRTNEVGRSMLACLSKGEDTERSQVLMWPGVPWMWPSVWARCHQNTWPWLSPPHVTARLKKALRITDRASDRRGSSGLLHPMYAAMQCNKQYLIFPSSVRSHTAAPQARHTAEVHLRRSVPSPGSTGSLTPQRSAASMSLARSSSSSSSTTHGASSSAAAATAAAAAAAAAAGLHIAPGSLPAAETTSHAARNGAAAAAASTAVIMRLRPSICPLSVIHDVPLITYGSDDTTVYIVDVTARSFAAGRGAGGGGGGHGNGGNGGGGGALAADRPLTVTVLKAHRAAVTAVGWSYDEALLASADADGTVVLWQRSRLF